MKNRKASKNAREWKEHGKAEEKMKSQLSWEKQSLPKKLHSKQKKGELPELEAKNKEIQAQLGKMTEGALTDGEKEGIG